MSENNNSIYNKALVFTVVALVVILIGTIATVFVKTSIPTINITPNTDLAIQYG